MKEQAEPSDSVSDANAATSCPFTLIVSDEDDEELMMSGLQQPDLSRGYSEQKRSYFKGLSSIILKTFLTLEQEFDF